MSLKLKVLAAAFALSSCFSATAAPRTYIAPAAERDATRAIASAYRALSAKIPLELYDVDGLAESLDYDVAAAADFVRDNIAYDPYLGVMRGPEGTISASAGSSWDQAVLLAALINSMAGEAMIVKGTLEKKDAERLLIGSFSKRIPLSSGISVDDVTDMFKEFVPIDRLSSVTAEALELEDHVDQNVALAEKDVSELAKRISTSLKASGVSIAKTDKVLTSKLLDQVAEEYVWVRYRDTPNDPWIDAHPAFQGAAAPKVEPETFFSGTVPEDRLHKIEFRLEMERKTGDKFDRVSIMSPYVRPAANLALTQITIGIAPNTIRDDGEAGYFVPIVNQKPAERAQAFTLQGLTAPAEDVVAGPEIFATVGSKYAGALGALNETNGKTDSAPRLSGVILTVVHISPGGKSTSVERRLTDFRQKLPEKPSRLVSFQGIVDVNVGPENGARAMKDALESAANFARVAPYYRAIFDGTMTTEEAISHPAFAPDQIRPAWSEMLSAGNAFNQDASEQTKLVRIGPMVSMRRMHNTRSAKGIVRQTVDILTDQTRSITYAAGAVSVSPSDNYEQGIRATLAEHALGAGSASTDWRRLGTSSVLTDRASVATWSDRAGASPLVRDRLNADLDNGTIVVMLDRSDDPVWWRIDVATGQTLGMGAHGGEVTVEYGVVSAVFALAGFVISALDCNDIYRNNEAMRKCCVVGNALVSAGSAGLLAPVTGLVKPVAAGLEAAAGYIFFQLTFEVVTLPISGMTSKRIDSVCRGMWE